MNQLNAERDNAENIEELTGKVESLLETPGEELGIAAAGLIDLLCEGGNQNTASKFIDIAISNLREATSLEGRRALAGILIFDSSKVMTGGNLSEAEEKLNEAWGIALEVNEAELMCKILNLQAVVMQRQDRLKDALITYRRGLRIARERGNEKFTARFLFNTGVVFMTFKSMADQVKKYNFEAETIYRRIGDVRGLAYSLVVSSSIWKNRGDTGKAVECARESLEIRRKLGIECDVAHSLRSVAGLLDPKEQMEEVISCYLEASDLYKKNGHNISFISVQLRYADVLLKNDRISEAETIIDQAVLMFKNIEGYTKTKMFMHEVLRDLEKSRGNWKNALEEAQKLEVFRIEFRRKNITRELNAVCAQWDAELVERERCALSIKNSELKNLNDELDETLGKISRMKKLLPMCPRCGRVKDSEGYWQKLDVFFMEHSTVRVSHGLCENCRRKLYPQLDREQEKI